MSADVTPAQKAPVFRDTLGASWVNDKDKPYFHVMPRHGWLNDPNGPIYHEGKYHVFYQHVRGSAEWAFGIVWGHAVSSDLVHWHHEDAAIEPTPRGYDADGCWSGNTVIDTDGTPTILYTGIRRHSGKSSVPLPPKEKDLNLPQIETQCIARSSADDKLLQKWTTASEPVIRWPPTELGKLTGFRDPFIIQRKTETSPWKLIVGSGISKDSEQSGLSHGTILLYHSDSLTEGWELQGILEDGLSKECQDGKCFDLGEMWECPFFTQLPEFGSSSLSSSWILCVSPYPHHLPAIIEKQPTNPVLYWLGGYQNGRFGMKNAPGPKLMDLGDIAYAPTIFQAEKGRCMLFFWLQELRPGTGCDYSGCLSVPRVLSLQDGRLRQDPAEEINQLRDGERHFTENISVNTEKAQAIPETDSQAQDMTVTLERGDASQTGILLRAYLRPSFEGKEISTHAILIDWENSTLEVVTVDSLDEETLTFEPSSISKRIGGPVLIQNDKLQLRFLIDHSCIEVFTEFGQTLSTRIYKTKPPEEADNRLHVVSIGGSSTAKDISVYRMNSIWQSAS